MGTSITHFKGHGFWLRDGVLATLLGLLVVDLDGATDDGWLNVTLDYWTLQAVAGFNGCMQPDLDWHLCDESRRDLVLEVARPLPDRIPDDESLVLLSEDLFDQRASRVLGSTAWQRPQAVAGWLKP